MTVYNQRPRRKSKTGFKHALPKCEVRLWGKNLPLQIKGMRQNYEMALQELDGRGRRHYFKPIHFG